ncbi:hypothetical protein FQA39_LY09291 [Lamprigera yunnana]|nr:hypothetical protein FQA39_LY09291 [Lamprigera yunnana]
MMNILILLVGVIIGLSQQLDIDKVVKDFEEIVDAEAKDCYKENSLTRDQLDNNLKKREFPNDKSFKCFFLCVATHLNITDDSGNYNEQIFKKYLLVESDSLKDRIYKSCKDIKGIDACDTIYLVGMCATGIAMSDQ